MDVFNKHHTEIFHTFEFSLMNLLKLNSLRYIPLELTEDVKMDGFIAKNQVIRNIGFTFSK